jgi:ribosomal-protein-alanine N-acetyltransferase
MPGSLSFPDGHIEAHIRWLTRADMPEVMRIEQASFDDPWSKKEFDEILRDRDIVAQAAASRRFGNVLGYSVYRLAKRQFEIINLAIAPEDRRYDVATQLVANLTGRLDRDRRHRVIANVRETNLGAQLFFRSCGFRAVEVLRNHFDNGESAYRFEYLLPDLLESLRESAATGNH